MSWGEKEMSLFAIICTGLALALTGSVLMLLLPPVFGLPWRLTVKRCIWFVLGFEVIVAAVFCVFNGARPTAGGQVVWHIARLFQICILCVLNNKLLKGLKHARLTIPYTIVASLLAQIAQYGIITLIY